MLLAVFLLAGCTGGGSGIPAPPATPQSAGSASQSAAQAGPVRMAVVLPESSHSFFAETLAHAEAQLRVLAGQDGFEYRLQTGADAAAMAEVVTALADFAPNVLLLWPPEDNAALAQATQAMQAAGAVLVLYGGQLTGVSPAAAITGDNAAIGQWTGEKLLKVFANELDGGQPLGFLRFAGAGGGVSAQRATAMDKSLAAAGATDIFTQLAPDFITGWDGEAAHEAMVDWLAQATAEERAALRFIVAQDDELLDGVKAAVDAWMEEHPGGLDIRLYCGVGGRRETLEAFYPVDETYGEPVAVEDDAGDAPDDAPPRPAPELVTYYYSPSFIRQAVLLADAAARGAQYNGQDIAGQTFLIPTIEIDATTANAFRAGMEFEERYSL